MANQSISRDNISESISKYSIRDAASVRPSVMSEKSIRRIESTVSDRRKESRRMSKLMENVAVIANYPKSPDTCVLCGYGITSTKCLSCEFQGHAKCIQAFFCTVSKKVDLRRWRCPKCVTMSHMNQKNVEIRGWKEDKSSIGEMDAISETSNEKSDCPFCEVEADSENCECRACVENPIDVEEKTQIVKYNKCLQYRDLNSNMEYDCVGEEDGPTEEIATENCISTRICWSITWLFLLFTFAFPIAAISALFYIFIHCFEACCDCCHPVCCFFLEGIKLPGTCCRGICSGEQMCN